MEQIYIHRVLGILGETVSAAASRERAVITSGFIYSLQKHNPQ